MASTTKKAAAGAALDAANTAAALLAQARAATREERAGRARRRPRGLFDLSLDELRLDVRKSRKLDTDITESVTAATLESTIEGASTLVVVVEDTHGELLTSDVLAEWTWGDRPLEEPAWVREGRDVQVMIDDYPYTLVRVEKSGTTLTLTFEDRAVTYLRRHRGARKVARSRATRAQFVRTLVLEVRADGGIGLFCPELTVRQPIGKAAERVTDRQRREEGRSGIADGASLTIKGTRATPAQLRIAERLLDVAYSMDAPARAVIALVMAGIVESVMSNDTTPDQYGSIGVLQARVDGSESSRGADGGPVSRAQALDVEYMARSFLIDSSTKGFASKGGAIYLARVHPDWTPGQIAQRVEMSAYPDRYDRYRAEAEAIIAAYEGGGGRSILVTKEYEFSRGADENSWDAIGRLGEEVRWRRFMRLGRLWYVSEDYLFRQKAALRISEEDSGVDWIDFEMDVFARGRNPVAELTVQARAYRWTARPGDVVIVEGQGPADGRWLVSTVSVDLLDALGTLTITLRKPMRQKPEPAPETSEKTIGGSGGTGVVEGEGVEAAYAAAEAISSRGYPYVWGGGHASVGVPDGGTGRDPGTGFDCSGQTGAIVHAGGMWPEAWGTSVPASGTFASSWGVPGEGRTMTVWANGEHVWIEFKLAGKPGRRADTSPQGDGPNGPRLRNTFRSTDGFTARHWPGT